jgi:hypothetical protein
MGTLRFRFNNPKTFLQFYKILVTVKSDTYTTTGLQFFASISTH